MRIAIIYSVPTKRALQSQYLATEEDTRESAEEVLRALGAKGAEAHLVPVSDDAIEQTIQALHADCLFNLIEWTGLDLPLAGRALRQIEQTGIPFTGASAQNYLATADKVAMKHLLDQQNLPTARWQAFDAGGEGIRTDFHYPVIIKPSLEHCSIGLTKDAIVSDADTLQKRVKEFLHMFHQPLLIEEFIDGPELQVTVLETEKGLTVLPPAEVFFDQGTTTFLTFESRWNEDHPEFKKSHVRLFTKPSDQIELVSKDTFKKLKFRDYSRLDMRLRGKEIYILEANSNPGLGDDEEYGMTISYRAAGMTFSDFVWNIVQSCMRRFGRINPA